MTDKILCEIESFATEGIFRLVVSNIIGNRYEDVVNGVDIYLKRETYTMVSLWVRDPKLRWISLGEIVTDSKYHAILEIISKLKLYFQEDTMTNMTKAELEQKYWEAQRKIDEYERERDRLLKDIDERDQSISDLIDANEKLTKENEKLSVDISREKAKHDAATEKCKEMTKDIEFWKEKTYEMDKKNCELRSRNRELEKEFAEKSKQFGMRIEVTPETCQTIDILQKKIEKLEEENVELKNALEADELKARKNWINSRFGRMGYFDTDMAENLRKDLRMVNCVVENVLKPNGYSSMYAPFSKHPTELEMYKALLRIHEIIEEDID